jgi:nucleotide-binding universal stress UspA family protein
MLKRVMVTLDGSRLAEEALSYAQHITAEKGEVVLLSVVDIPEFPAYSFYPAPVTVREPENSEAVKKLKGQTRDYLQQIADSLRKIGFQVRMEIRVGEPATTIVETADELEVDAIIMSTHGRSGFSRWLFGSVTQKVLNAMPCPVLVIPGTQRMLARQEQSEAASVQ